MNIYDLLKKMRKIKVKQYVDNLNNGLHDWQKLSLDAPFYFNQPITYEKEKNDVKTLRIRIFLQRR